MAVLPMQKRGVFAIYDTGVPECLDDNTKYHTLVLLHGYLWHSDIFSRLVPLTKTEYPCRLVLVNRPGYPGATPFTTNEFQRIASSKPEDQYARTFCKGQAQEIYDFLKDFVQSENISEEGGISIAGWSFGSTFAMIFLAYAPQLNQSHGFDLRPYIHSVVAYDPPDGVFGYHPPSGQWDPTSESSVPPERIMSELFPRWATGYYKHGSTPSELEYRVPLSDPPATIHTIPEGFVFLPAVIAPDGSDAVVAGFLFGSGGFADTKDQALYPATTSTVTEDAATRGGWNGVPLHVVWCDHSIGSAVHCAMSFQTEIDEASRAGKVTRPVKITRIRGANHFAHWDQPKEVLSVLLGSRRTYF